MEKSELTVELGVEEIPASMIEKAADQFADILVELIEKNRLSSGEQVLWYTPRRIIVGIRDIPDCQDDLIETIIGPPRRIGYDGSGNATKAAMAFAKKNAIAPSRIRITDTPKGEYLCIERKVKGVETRKLMKSLIPEAVGKIEFSKTMHWSPDHFRFIRPLRWIVAFFGDKVVRFRVADVVSSDITSGHRFLGKPKIKVSGLVSLQNRLKENSVIVDPAERKKLIEEELLREAAACGGRLLDDPELMETVVNLNEAPSVVRGTFENRFLLLPKEILVTVMREHQKYFSVLNDSEQLMPAFLAVVNLRTDKKNAIRTGHERVLRARLDDAAFFWTTDRKTKLAEREEQLKNVVFQEKLGTYFDKNQRVLDLIPKVSQSVGRSDCVEDLLKAGHIFKCDLVTEMVKEFTDLQGIVGGLYARAEGYSDGVWQAVYEQYSPKSADSPSPVSKTGAILALVDRLDTVCGCFTAGLIPSGSGDPFAVRRQGNGILKILFDHRLSLSMKRSIRWSLEAYGRYSEDTLKELTGFFEGRLRFMFEEMGYTYDCVQAVLEAGFDNPLDALQRLKALEELRKEADFLSLVSNFKRIVNITSQEKSGEGSPDDSKFEMREEKELWNRFLEIRPQVENARELHDYGTAFRSLASMREVVDLFFQEVLVMAENPDVRANRISLLCCISNLFKSLADISKIVIEKGAV
ncbi:MAG: glycine--tRNA ligase subunit beta [Acidobacteriota bacterium]